MSEEIKDVVTISVDGAEIEMDRRTFKRMLTRASLFTSDNSKNIYNKWKQGLPDSAHSFLSDIKDNGSDDDTWTSWEAKLFNLREQLIEDERLIESIQLISEHLSNHTNWNK